MKIPLFYIVFHSFWASAQKSPGGNEDSLSDTTCLTQFSRFYYESPGGDEYLLDDAMSIVSILLRFGGFVIFWVSCKVHIHVCMCDAM